MMKQGNRTQLPMSFQYRIVIDGHIRWRWMQSIPEKDKNGKTIWYGATSDITALIDYIASVEQILFDIAHVIRRPISTMMGLTKLITEFQLSAEEIKETSKKIYIVTEEMDKFSRELNEIYSQKRDNSEFSVDISSLLDKRGSLFSQK
jgi:hypothetical protein